MKKKAFVLILALFISSLLCPSNNTKTNVYNNEINVLTGNDNCLSGKYIIDEHAKKSNKQYSSSAIICDQAGAKYQGDGGKDSGIYCIDKKSCTDTGPNAITICTAYDARWVCDVKEDTSGSSGSSGGSNSSSNPNCKIGSYSSVSKAGTGGATVPKCDEPGQTYNSSYTVCYKANEYEENTYNGNRIYNYYTYNFVCEDDWHETDDSYNYVANNGSIIGDGEMSCSSLGNFKGDLQNIFKAFKIVAPILTLVLSTIEFLVAITSKEASGLKTAGKKFGTRIILVVVLFFLPIILNIILDLVFPGASTCVD